MAKKNPQNIERRAMVEKMRQEQARKERMRSFGILGFCIVVVVALLVAAGIPYYNDWKADQRLRALKIEDIGATKSAASCDPVKKESASGSGQHTAMGQPIEYKQAPPAFGQHWPIWAGHPSGPELRSFYAPADRPEVEYLVHNLEHGYTVVWYDDTVKAGSKAYQDLEQIADKVGISNRVIMAPWTSADGAAFPEGKHVALTHWTGPTDQEGITQYCAAPSGSVVKKFVGDYPASNAPEPGAG